MFTLKNKTTKPVNNSNKILKEKNTYISGNVLLLVKHQERLPDIKVT